MSHYFLLSKHLVIVDIVVGNEMNPLNFDDALLEEFSRDWIPNGLQQHGQGTPNLVFGFHHNLRRAYLSLSCTPTTSWLSCSQLVQYFKDQIIMKIQGICQELLESNLIFTCQFGVSLVFGQTVVAMGNNEATEALMSRYISNSVQDLTESNIDEFLTQGSAKLDEKIASFTNRSSGYSVKQISSLEFTFIKKHPLTHRARSFIPTPQALAAKKAIINICNQDDDKCFLYCILCHLHYNDISNRNHSRVYMYQPYLNELEYDESDFPMRISNINKFEKANNLSINVLRWHDKPLDTPNLNDKITAVQNPFVSVEYMSKNVGEGLPIITLLLLENATNSHYTLVRNLNRLMNHDKGTLSSIYIHNRSWCARCLRSFYTQKAFDLHKRLCLSFIKFGPTTYNIPDCSHIEFNEWQKSVPLSYVVYADFESILEKTEDTSKIQKHIPIMASYLLVPSETIKGQIPITYKHFYGPGCILDFLSSLADCARTVKVWYDEHANKSMTMLTHQQETSFANAKYCYLCKKAFNGNVKVRDHCHITGMYLGAAHNQCNLHRRQPKFLPVLFHNLRRYDIHHIMKYAIGQFPEWNLSVIAQTSETYLAMKCNIGDGVIIKFLDSLQFVSTSLDQAVKLMKKDDLKLSGQLPHLTDNGSKAVFPYSYVDSQAKLEMESNSLPPYQAFFDVLSNTIPITEEDYHLANETYKRWGCKCLKDYYEKYLQLDVYLLADVFQNFRELAQMEDALEPLHFYSIPGLSWTSAFKMTGSRLEILKDIGMYEWIESAIRGGLAFVNKHYVKREPNKREILYLDVNNLYGWALSNPLPCGDFKWVTHELELEDLINAMKNNWVDYAHSEIGHFFEVDVSIPLELHDFFSQLPPFPEHKVPPPQQFANGLQHSGRKVKKLICTLEPKKHYIIHGRLLHFFISLGVQVDKVHCAVQFKQARVFQDYIEHNTVQRSKTTNEFQRNYYKLRNNSLYGKTCENVRKHRDLRICNNPEKLITLNSQTRMRKSIEFDENLVGVFMQKASITLDKPIYIGETVLDLSKLLMYEIYYKRLLTYANEMCGEINILGGDTDSFFLEVINIPLEQLLKRMKDDKFLDTSNYPAEHPLFSRQVASKIGCVKDESGGDVFEEAIFLQPKSYSMKTNAKSNTIRRAKGVQRQILKNEIHHEDYMAMYQRFGDIFHLADNDNPLFINQPLVKRQRRFGSDKHQLFTYETNKVTLSCRDNKRQWISQNESLPFGHYKLN